MHHHHHHHHHHQPFVLLYTPPLKASPKTFPVSKNPSFFKKKHHLVIPCISQKISFPQITPRPPLPSYPKSPTTEHLRRIHCCRTCDNRRYNTCTFSVEVEVTVTGGPPEDRITTAGEVTWRSSFQTTSGANGNE